MLTISAEDHNFKHSWRTEDAVFIDSGGTKQQPKIVRRFYNILIFNERTEISYGVVNNLGQSEI